MNKTSLDWGFFWRHGAWLRPSLGICAAHKPHECYDEFEFQIPVGGKNVYQADRHLCRMEEMRQSK
jgi:NADH:ubiquinone oxidoreductase subunit D